MMSGQRSLFSALTEHSPSSLSKHLTHGMQLFQKPNCKGLFSQCCDSQTQDTALKCATDVLLSSAAGQHRRGWNALLVSSSSCALPYCL